MEKLERKIYLEEQLKIAQEELLVIESYIPESSIDPDYDGWLEIYQRTLKQVEWLKEQLDIGDLN